MTTAGDSSADHSADHSPDLNPDLSPGLRADIRVGISGWRYPPWRGEFFPAGLAQSKELERERMASVAGGMGLPGLPGMR